MQIGNLYKNPSPDTLKLQQVYKEERFHVMQLQIKKDELLKPHHSTTDALLVVVEGAIVFHLHDENFHLQKGDMLSFKKK